ncbi:MAG: hypothetical protein KDK39_04075 [Leptospiraceae bacterium]|nr:hypothetical protein [Leptospiraceae bacterium]
MLLSCRSQSGLLRRLLIPLASVSLVWLPVACKKADPVPPEVAARYFQHAAVFCQSITACIQESVRERLQNQVERRDLVLNRMNKELCHKNQLQLLGELETDPNGLKQPGYNAELYKNYAECASSLQKAPDCQAVRSIYNTLPACQKIRLSQLQPDS